MPNVLVWGKTRDLIAGDLPPGLSVAEVSSLKEVRKHGDSQGALLLIDPATIGAHEEGIQEFLRDGGSTSTLLVAVAEAKAGDEALRRFPFVDDLLVTPVTAGRLHLRLKWAFEALNNRRIRQQLEQALERRGAELERKGAELHELNEIGVALSAERDIKKLLDLILKKSREITAADAGSLYLVERGQDEMVQTDDHLRFKLTQNHSVQVLFEEQLMPLSETSIAGYVALTGKGVNVADAYNLTPGSPFKISRSWDEQSGYRTKSMLVVPMRDHKDVVIGVVQLINKKRDAGAVLQPVAMVDEEVIPFAAVDEELVTSLASQAAVAYENTLLIQKLKSLFESFVKASVVTIEKRDPATSGHSGRVATLTVALAQKVDAATTAPFHDLRFSPDQIQEIRYASLLHDFGKVGVKERYLLKAKKLYDSNQELIEQRFAYIGRTLEVEYLRSRMQQIEAGAPREMLVQMDRAFEARREETAQLLETIRQANNPSILEGESVRAVLVDLAKRRYLDGTGKEQYYLTEREVEALSIGRGSLTVKERDEINKHVEHTYAFLKELPWTSELRQVPEIAGKHHEKLDGSGYPYGLKGTEAIPIQSRMMTICDIYDALTANDRPYKPAVQVDRALDILTKEEAGRGKIDRDLLEIFIGAKIYETTSKASAEATR
jgi:HD-GYP domain-containing protein (c-di-GMP phosphodiesterase class II)